MFKKCILIAIGSSLSLLFISCASNANNTLTKDINEARARLQKGDINAAADYCKLQKTITSKSSPYASLCLPKKKDLNNQTKSLSYAQSTIYQKYQKMLLADRSVNAKAARTAQTLLASRQQTLKDKKALETANNFLRSKNKSVPEYRVFDYRQKRNLTNDLRRQSMQQYRAHAFIVLRNPELSGNAVWLRKATHPAIFNTDGTRPTSIERWYKENGSYHRAIANEEGRLIGSITLDPQREQQTFLLDINGDRLVDISAILRDGEEIIMATPEAMYFLEQWRAGSNALCGSTAQGGPVGTDTLNAFAAEAASGPQPPAIPGCLLSPGGGGGMSRFPQDFSFDSSPCASLERLSANNPSPGQGFMESLCRSSGHQVGGGSNLVADGIRRAPCYTVAGCHLNTQPPRPQATLREIFPLDEPTEEDIAEWTEDYARNSGPNTLEGTGQSGACSGGLCDTNGDGTADAYDTNDDGDADASCDPCAPPNEASGNGGTTEPVSPDDYNSFATYCADLGNNYRQSMLDMCRVQEAGEPGDTDCTDPVTNPDPRMRAIASLSPADAASVASNDKVGGLTCAETPGRASIVDANCPEGNPVADPANPDEPVPCLNGGSSGGGDVSLDMMFGSALAFEFCDGRLCTKPDQLLQLGPAAKLRTDRL